MCKIRSVVGLGNPGSDYEITRHNLGFMVLDRLADRWRLRFKPGKGRYYFTENTKPDNPITLIKPTTYMNNSGIAVRQITEQLQIGPEEIMVIVDDLSLPFGQIRIRMKGSSGGHNGLNSIIYSLGSENFPRLRIGIKPDRPIYDTVKFVLSRFSRAEMKELPFVIENSCDAVESIINYGYSIAMTKFNTQSKRE